MNNLGQLIFRTVLYDMKSVGICTVQEFTYEPKEHNSKDKLKNFFFTVINAIRMEGQKYHLDVILCLEFVCGVGVLRAPPGPVARGGGPGAALRQPVDKHTLQHLERSRRTRFERLRRFLP